MKNGEQLVTHQNLSLARKTAVVGFVYFTEIIFVPLDGSADSGRVAPARAVCRLPRRARTLPLTHAYTL